MACSACAKRRQQQMQRSTRQTTTTTTRDNPRTAVQKGATLLDKMRFTGR